MIPVRIMEHLPRRLQFPLQILSQSGEGEVQEIRMRLGSPLHLLTARGEGFLGSDGFLTGRGKQAVIIEDKDLEQFLLSVSGGSFYTLEEDMRWGFTTLAGGHRVGFAGQALMENGYLKRFRQISSVNIRVARQYQGCSRKILPYLLCPTEKTILSTLVVSPPGAGKTTVLRDLILQCSSGVEELGLAGVKVGVVDERSEIAACYQGKPQLDVGPRTDILDACPKYRGLLLLLRAMSPGVLACDELGQEEDARAIRETARAGAVMLTTLHGSALADLKKRPLLEEIMGQNFFQRLVFLSSRRGPATLEGITDGEGQTIFQKEEGEVR